MTEQHMPSTQAATSPEGPAVSTAAVGPLTIRDLVVLGSVAIIFIASVVPIIVTLTGSLNLWNTSGLFYIGVGVVLPLVVGGLFLARRLSPGTKVRIGSLSIDQFASVVAAFATFFFFTGTVTNFRIAFLVGLIGSLLLLVATVCAQWVPFLASDFAGRAEVPAHVAARDAAPAAKQPATPKPAGAKPGAPASAGGVQTGGMPFGDAQSGVTQSGQGQGSQGQNVSAENAAEVQTGARSAGQAPAGHTSAGQIFTPANSSNPAGHAGAAQAGAGHAGAVQARSGQAPAAQAAAAAAGGLSGAAAGAGIAGTRSAAGQPAATQPAGAGEATRREAASGAGSSHGAAPAAGQSAAQAGEAKSTGSDAAAPTAAASATPASRDQGVSGSSDDAAATTLNPQVARPAGGNAATGAVATNIAASSSSAKDEAASNAAASPAKESIAATVNPKAGATRVIAEPFWFAVDRPQNVIDEKTRQFIFKLTPGSWILALEDRGNSFLVQDSHGKTGVLLDLVGIERASDSE